MKNLFTRLFYLLLLVFITSTSVSAQGTQNDDFIIRLISSGITTVDYAKVAAAGECGWGYAAFGASVKQEFSGEIVWAYDNVGQDSVCCDTIIQDLTGKIALIRRGTCNFSLKAYWAQQAGAIAVIIVNHYNDPTHTACTTTGMSAGTNAALDTIPCVFLPRAYAEVIDAEIAAGHHPVAHFLLPRMLDGFAEYSFATPISQIDTLGNMSLRYINRSSSIQPNVALKVNIDGPSGYVYTETVPLGDLEIGKDTTVDFSAYVPPSVLGDFTVTFTNNKYSESRDSIARHFRHTEHTFANDNFIIDPYGVGPTHADFQTTFKFQTGSLYLTGDNGARAIAISFGIGLLPDSTSVIVPGADPMTNDIIVQVYDGDIDNDGFIDVETTWQAMDDALQVVALGTFTMQDDHVFDSIYTMPLMDLEGHPYVNLIPNHPYYASLSYNGLLAGLGKSVRFSNTAEENRYINFPSNPYQPKDVMLELVGSTIIQRLQIDPNWVDTKVPQLEANRVLLSPNPANDLVNLDISLSEVNKVVTVRLLDWTGSVVKSEFRRDFQNGRIGFNTASLPSGAYLVWVTTNEGSNFKKVMVCH
jgi:PA domain/Secretion system C-terminal sorting domain